MVVVTGTPGPDKRVAVAVNFVRRLWRLFPGAEAMRAESRRRPSGRQLLMEEADGRRVTGRRARFGTASTLARIPFPLVSIGRSLYKNCAILIEIQNKAE